MLYGRGPLPDKLDICWKNDGVKNATEIVPKKQIINNQLIVILFLDFGCYIVKKMDGLCTIYLQSKRICGVFVNHLVVRTLLLHTNFHNSFQNSGFKELLLRAKQAVLIV